MPSQYLLCKNLFIHSHKVYLHDCKLEYFLGFLILNFHCLRFPTIIRYFLSSVSVNFKNDNDFQDISCLVSRSSHSEIFSDQWRLLQYSPSILFGRNVFP